MLLLLGHLSCLVSNLQDDQELNPVCFRKALNADGKLLRH